MVITMAKEDASPRVDHLEYTISEAGQVHVYDMCLSLTICYVGFKDRAEAERFVLSQGERWE